MTTEQDTDQAAARPSSGIAIDPGQLTRMRDLRAMSRAVLAVRVGELLFDRNLFAEVVTGRVQPDAQMARSVWLALDCEPHDILRGLPPGLPAADVPLWLRRNSGWWLDTGAVNGRRGQRRVMDGQEIRAWTDADLAEAAARHWFSRDMVNKIERGDRRPSALTLAAICQVLECEPGQLMEGSQPLPDGQTERHRELLDYNAGMRAFAASHGISCQNPRTRRMQYTQELRDAYEAYLTGTPNDMPARRARLGLPAIAS